MPTASVAGVAAPREFTSFDRIELDMLRNSGELETMRAVDPLTLKNKHQGMIAFCLTDIPSKIPGGLPNITAVRVFKSEDGKFSFAPILKYSEKVLLLQQAEAKSKLESEQMATRSRERAAQAVVTKSEEKFNSPKIQKAQEKRARKENKLVSGKAPQKTVPQDPNWKKDLKAVKPGPPPKPEPRIEFKPAQLTGRVIVLSSKQTYRRGA